MITRFLMITVATVTFSSHAMEKKFDLQEIFTLAQRDPSHQPFIEIYFKEELNTMDSVRTHRFIELQNAVLKQTRDHQATEATKTCLLNHLQLAYQKKQQEFHQAAIEESKKKIEELLATLSAQQVTP